MDEPRIAIIGQGGQGRTLADTILSKAIRNSEEMKLLQAYLDTGLTPEEITRQQRIIELKSKCFNQLKAKFEQLLKMYESGCDGYVELWRELTEYQDAEEQGLLIRLPCKIGTPVIKLIFNQHDGDHMEPDIFRIDMIEEFGKTVFNSTEAAKEAWKLKVANSIWKGSERID